MTTEEIIADMKEEEINKRIAEACGWADITRITSNGWLQAQELDLAIEEEEQQIK